MRDGDTIVVGLIPIRIANLDCAETGTAAGERATRRLIGVLGAQMEDVNRFAAEWFINEYAVSQR